MVANHINKPPNMSSSSNLNENQRHDDDPKWTMVVPYHICIKYGIYHLICDKISKENWNKNIEINSKKKKIININNYGNFNPSTSRKKKYRKITTPMIYMMEFTEKFLSSFLCFMFVQPAIFGLVEVFTLYLIEWSNFEWVYPINKFRFKLAHMYSHMTMYMVVMDHHLIHYTTTILLH